MRFHPSTLYTAAILIAMLAPSAARAGQGIPYSASEAREVLQAVCAGDIKTEALKHGTSYGCGTCPAFTSFAGERAGRGNGVEFELRTVLKGAFTRPKANEWLVEFFGCEPHANNFGGTMLLARSGSGMRRVRYFQGVIGLVRSYPLKSGRELVLSHAGYTGQGESDGWVSTLEFSPASQPLERTLLRTEDSSGNYCQEKRVRIAYIFKIASPDLNGDGVPDLRVTVRRGDVNVPGQYQGKCDQEFKLPEVPAYQIDFLFDGRAFHVAPASAAALRRVTDGNRQ